MNYLIETKDYFYSKIEILAENNDEAFERVSDLLTENKLTLLYNIDENKTLFSKSEESLK